MDLPAWRKDTNASLLRGLKTGVADCQNLVAEQNIRLALNRRPKSQPRDHAARVSPQRIVDEFRRYGKLHDAIIRIVPSRVRAKTITAAGRVRSDSRRSENRDEDGTATGACVAALFLWVLAKEYFNDKTQVRRGFHAIHAAHVPLLQSRVVITDSRAWRLPRHCHAAGERLL
jgi:hypothetical protein